MSNSRAQIAFDARSRRTRDSEGRMRVQDAVLSVAEINPYWGREIPRAQALGLDPNAVYDLLRPAAELEAAASTFDGLPLLVRHVVQTAAEPRKEYIAGSIYNVRFDAPFLRGDLLVFDATAIAGIEDDSLRDLSCSYRYTAVMEAGEIDGRAYAGRMTRLEGNHVALVDDGRASAAHVPDSALQPEEEAMAQKDLETLAARVDSLAASVEKLAHAHDESLRKAEEDERKGEEAELERKRKAEEDERKGEEAELERKRKAEEDERKGERRAEDNEPPALDRKSVEEMLAAAVAAERKRAAAVEQARRDCREDLGDMIAYDDAGEIYRAALVSRGVDVSTIPDGAEHAAYQAAAAASSARSHAHDRSAVDDKFPFNVAHLRAH